VEKGDFIGISPVPVRVEVCCIMPDVTKDPDRARKTMHDILAPRTSMCRQ